MDDYKTLGVLKDATLEEIKKAYYKRSKEVHPDVSDNPTAAEDFRGLTDAYHRLLGAKPRVERDPIPNKNYYRVLEEEPTYYKVELPLEAKEGGYLWLMLDMTEYRVRIPTTNATILRTRVGRSEVVLKFKE